MHKAFSFLDFAARYQPGFRNNIVRVGEVPGLIKKYKSYECYTTCFFFTEELREYVKERGSVAGYDGDAFAPRLFLDIDDPEISKALDSARRILLLLLHDWKLPHKAVQCYFSGSKGFHIMIDSRVFGDVRPSRNVHVLFSKVREAIAKQARVNMDLTIKDKLRLFRIPNTINGKSGLYKIQLTIHEITKLKTEQIIEKAGKPQNLLNVDMPGLLPAINVKPNNKALNVYAKALSMTEERRVIVNIDYSLSIEEPEKVLCEARKQIWLSHIEEGLRHSCAMRMLSQFHVSGFGKEKSLGLMAEWNRNNNIALPEREIVSMVKSVYASPHPYSYGCRDSILQNFCPYRDRLKECESYRRFRDLVK